MLHKEGQKWILHHVLKMAKTLPSESQGKTLIKYIDSVIYMHLPVTATTVSLGCRPRHLSFIQNIRVVEWKLGKLP